MPRVRSIVAQVFAVNVAVLACCGVCSAGDPCAEFKLEASDGEAGDRNGSAVRIDGDVAVVGAYFENTRQGAAYVYRWDGAAWNEEQKLVASDGIAFDQFGWVADVSGDVIAVGAFSDDNETGAVYIYRFNGATWDEEVKLRAADTEEGDSFGWAVAIDGDVVVVGARLDTIDGIRCGSAYIFRYDDNLTQWLEETQLNPPDAGPEDRRGESVAVSGDIALMGAWADDNLGPDSGSIYVYRFNGATWDDEGQLLASDGTQEDFYGFGIDTDGVRIAVGAFGDDDKGDQSGSIYVYSHDGASWTQDAKLLASDGAAMDRIGFAVALEGNTLVGGAYWVDEDAVIQDVGALYVYRYSGSSWIEDCRIKTSDRAHRDEFARTVAISGDFVGGGAFKHDGLGNNAGAAYLYQLSGCAETVVPSDYAILFGAYEAGTLADLAESDDAYLEAEQRAPVSPLLPNIRVEIGGVAASATASEITVTVEASTTAMPSQSPQRLSLLDYDAGSYEIVDERTATLVDSVVQVVIDIDASRLLEAGTNALRMRGDWFDPGAVFVPRWFIGIDQAIWEITP